MEQRRELKSGEIDLIEYLAKKAEYPLNKFWHCYYKASPMNDGGMGSILLIPDGHSCKERMFKVQISECTLKDTDGTDIIISLNIDQDDYLFELDIWKCDFTPVISKIEDWIF